MFGNVQYTPEQLLQLANAQQQLQQQAHNVGFTPGLQGPSIPAYGQAINPALFHQFLSSQQQIQQAQVAASVPGVVPNPFNQEQFQQNFEAIQRLQALSVQQQQNAMSTQLAHGQQNALATLLQNHQNQNVHMMMDDSNHQTTAHNTNAMDCSGPTTSKTHIVDQQSMVDSALGSASSGSSSPGEAAEPTVKSSNLNANKLPILAPNPQVNVPCTAKCYHRCKLGLSCPRHSHKHLEKIKRKNKQAQVAAAAAAAATVLKADESQHEGSNNNIKPKSLETIASSSCISTTTANSTTQSVLPNIPTSQVTGASSASEDSTKRTFLDLYEVYNVIGVGGGGMVYSGRRIADSLPVAIKRVMREKVKRWEQVQGHNVPQEIALMLRCYGHRGIIRLVDWYECLDSFILIMERPERAVDLFDYIREVGRISEPEAANIFRQILEATLHIHSCGVVHRDIKDENVIMNRDSGEAKLIDFGCGTLLRETAYRDFSGTPEFYPPEWFIQREYFARTAAVWSLGVLLFDMLQGEIPFKQKEKIVENQPTFKHQVSVEAKHLISWLMSTDSKDRPKLEEISSHPWLVQFTRNTSSKTNSFTSSSSS